MIAGRREPAHTHQALDAKGQTVMEELNGGTENRHVPLQCQPANKGTRQQFELRPRPARPLKSTCKRCSLRGSYKRGTKAPAACRYIVGCNRADRSHLSHRTRAAEYSVQNVLELAVADWCCANGTLESFSPRPPPSARITRVLHRTAATQ